MVGLALRVAQLVLVADALSVDTRTHDAAVTDDSPLSKKRPSIALGSQMELTVPFIGDRSRSWVKCTVVDREDVGDRYVITVEGFPQSVKTLRNVPGSALRPPPPETGFNLAEMVGQSDTVSRANASAQLASSLGYILAAPPSFDCRKFPDFCKAPFMCNTFISMEGMGWYYHGMAQNGKGNPRAWCSLPQHESYLSHCLTRKDLVTAAEARANESMKTENQVDRELDASRCFIEGFCTDTAVSRTTTLEQANALCNIRYGMERWSLYGTYKAVPEDSHGAGGPHGGAEGYRGKHQTTPVTMSACATGRFHCDVMYCKQTYCKQDYYRKKYSHFLYA